MVYMCMGEVCVCVCVYVPLNQRKTIIPAPTIEAQGMLPHLIQNLLHFERSRDGLQQGRGPDGASGEVEEVLDELYVCVCVCVCV